MLSKMIVSKGHSRRLTGVKLLACMMGATSSGCRLAWGRHLTNTKRHFLSMMQSPTPVQDVSSSSYKRTRGHTTPGTASRPARRTASPTAQDVGTGFKKAATEAPQEFSGPFVQLPASAEPIVIDIPWESESVTWAKKKAPLVVENGAHRLRLPRCKWT